MDNLLAAAKSSQCESSPLRVYHSKNFDMKSLPIRQLTLWVWWGDIFYYRQISVQDCMQKALSRLKLGPGPGPWEWKCLHAAPSRALWYH